VVAVQIFTHLFVMSSRQWSYDWLRCENVTPGREKSGFLTIWV